MWSGEREMCFGEGVNGVFRSIENTIYVRHKMCSYHLMESLKLNRGLCSTVGMNPSLGVRPEFKPSLCHLLHSVGGLWESGTNPSDLQS